MFEYLLINLHMTVQNTQITLDVANKILLILTKNI